MSPHPTSGGETQHHAWPVRVTHWLLALSVLIMIGSGWRIYNASPIFPFKFPDFLTLSGDGEVALARNNDPGVATAIAWHFAGMWSLLAAWFGFVLWGAASGHFRRDFLPLSPRVFWRDFTAALTFRLKHRLGAYNAVQKAFYWGALLAVFGLIVSGAAIWKPVQTYPLEVLFGGFQGARIVHFLLMTAICGFIAVHVALVALVPRTLIAMIRGHVTILPARKNQL